jgi:S1-C subfamily serine protease
MLIPPFFVDCVAALGNIRPIPQPGGQPPQDRWTTTGTGFFYGAVINPNEEPNSYRTFLVTAKHVVQSHIDKTLDIRVRVNSSDVNKPVRDFNLPRVVGGPSNWFFHPNTKIDVAIIRINWDFLKENSIEPSFFTDNRTASNRATLVDRQVAAGDAIFVLGFPMGLTGEQRNYVVVRLGCIARISEMLDGATSDFLIDAFVYPGNSGGPVILRPEIIAIEKTKSQPTATLIGLVSNYLPYEDVAVSLQTNKPRIIFQENSGLAAILPVDFIDEAVAAYNAEFPDATPVKPEIVPAESEESSISPETPAATEAKPNETDEELRAARKARLEFLRKKFRRSG